MALRIRLARYGRTHHPIYRIVVAESSAPRDGKCVDVIGTYDPILSKLESFNIDKFQYWLQRGAKPTERVETIIKKNSGGEK
ncbi:MAG: 30S ribosomal protein S16 [Aquificaceae bacterium]